METSHTSIQRFIAREGIDFDSRTIGPTAKYEIHVQLPNFTTSKWRDPPKERILYLHADAANIQNNGMNTKVENPENSRSRVKKRANEGMRQKTKPAPPTLRKENRTKKEETKR